jgi:hypothetical protein
MRDVTILVSIAIDDDVTLEQARAFVSDAVGTALDDEYVSVDHGARQYARFTYNGEPASLPPFSFTE